MKCEQVMGFGGIDTLRVTMDNGEKFEIVEDRPTASTCNLDIRSLKGPINLAPISRNRVIIGRNP